MFNKALTIISLISITLVVTAGCGKGSDSTGSSSCTDLPVTSDSSALLSFAKTNGITSLQDTIGLYYQIISQGSGATPALGSKVFITYTGTFMDGTIFDSTTNASKTGFVLGDLIRGWQYGLPKIQVGGRIKLLIPSAYAYGCQGYGSAIPPYAPVYFDISLVSIQ